MVQIKSPEQIAKMREAGLVVAAIHAATREAAVPGATTKDLDEVARKQPAAAQIGWGCVDDLSIVHPGGLLP